MLKQHFLRRVILASPPCLALVGCVLSVVNHIIGDPSQEKIPSNQLADYPAADCTDIWSLSGQFTETSSLYWLRAMDCANRLVPMQARSEASTLVVNAQQGAFRRGILLGNANITPPERRETVTRLGALSLQISSQIRPLYQVQRSSQALQLRFAEERMCHSRLQQAFDSSLDTLRQQQQHSQSQLDPTTCKLENLTGTKHQLSVCEPDSNYNPDALHRSDKLITSDNEEDAASSADGVTP